MGYRGIVLGVCFVLASVTFSAVSEAGDDFSVASLSGKRGPAFSPNDVVFIQQYYSHAPKAFIDDIVKKEKALPAGAVSSIVRGKQLPKELVPYVMNEPASVARNLGPLPRGVDRKVLGARFLLLDTRLTVQDMVYLPTTVTAGKPK